MFTAAGSQCGGDADVAARAHRRECEACDRRKHSRDDGRHDEPVAIAGDERRRAGGHGREGGDAERGTHLVPGGHQPGGEAGPVVMDVAHRRDRRRREHQPDTHTENQEPGQEIGDVVGSVGCGREQQGSDGDQAQSADRQRSRTDPPDQTRGQVGSGADDQSQRQEREAGLERRVAEDPLKVERVEEEGADQDPSGAEHQPHARDQ